MASLSGSPAEAQGNQIRCTIGDRSVPILPQSHNTCPKPDDLDAARVKRREICVEARPYDDVQISMLSRVKAQKSNLVRGSLVPTEASRRKAVAEIVIAVEH